LQTVYSIPSWSVEFVILFHSSFLLLKLFQAVWQL
jgi:hypothetical protein